MEFTYRTQGTCARLITVATDGRTIEAVEFAGGCRGNLQAVARLVEGRSVEEVTGLLRGIQCRNGTSCPDQLSLALEEHLLRMAV